MPDDTRSRWDDEIRRRLASARLDPATELEIARELAQHLEDHYAELRAGGAEPDTARTRALAELDEDEVMRRELGRIRRRESTVVAPGAPARGSWLSDLWQDTRYAVRVLTASRGFTAIALLTLALGIGATTAIFSVVHGVLLTPLPYDRDGRLVRVLLTTAPPPGQLVPAGPASRARRMTPSLPALRQLQDRADVFAGVGAWIGTPLTLLEGGSAQRVTSIEVTPGFLETLNSPPVLGRTFVESDLHEPVAIISHGYWQRQFAGDPAVLGRTIRALEGDRTVIGVLPATFAFLRSDFWLPLSVKPWMDREGWGGNMIARLKPDVGIQPARAAVSRLVQQLQEEGVWTKGAGVEVASQHAWNVQSARPTLLMLFGATGFILLLAIANVGGLMVARGAERLRELGIRTSLGADRSRLIRQLLTESVLLSICGGLAGVLLAWLTLHTLLSVLPLSLPAGMDPRVDGRVLAFGVVLSTLSGCLFGLLPAIRLTRGTGAVVKGGGSGAAVSSRRFASGMVLVQAALAVMLLVGAGLMVRSLQRLLGVELGFEPEDVLVLEVHPVLTGEDLAPRRAALYRAIVDRLSSVPSVTSVGAIDTLPFDSVSYGSVEIDASAAPLRDVSRRSILPGYFRVMGIAFLAGQNLAAADGAAGRCGVVVNSRAARALWNDDRPLGRRLRRDAASEWCEVVGVIRDVRHFSRESPVLPEIYFDARRSAPSELSFVVRSEMPQAMVPVVRGRLAGLPETAIVQRLRPMASVVSLGSAQRQQRAQLLSAFGALGLLIACVGIFGLTAYAVARRTQEIGVRIALGATPGRVLQSVMAGFVPAILGGVVLGLFGSWAASRTFESYLFGVTPTDPPTLAAVAILFIAVACLACYLPARRAQKVDPIVALRAE